MTFLPLFAVLLIAGERLAQPGLRVTPPQISVGAFYSGADVTIEGSAAAGSKIIVTITGSDREERFNQKARYGPLWVSAGRLHISGVPSLFLRFSTEPVAAFLGRESIERLRLDASSLQSNILIEPRPRDSLRQDAIRRDYMALKKTEGVYSFGDSGIVLSQAGEATAFALKCAWPKKAPPGVYQVHVYEVRDRAVVGESCIALPVVRTGFPEWLAGMAENRAPLYGMVAVLVGALAGFGIDFLTTCLLGKKKSAVSH